MKDDVIFQATGRAGPSDSKTVRVLRFDVPAGVEALTLWFDYGPRVATEREQNLRMLEAAFDLHIRRRRPSMTDEEIARHREALGVDRRASSLDNLLNVVLIDPEGRWRGRWDRNPASKGDLLLARERASRGFLAGEIPAGTWSVAIEIHGIFGASDVSYEVRVASRPSPTAAELESLHAPAPPATSKRRGKGVYFGEMHSHTVHSDGKWELAELAQRAHAASADFLCLTDHNTVSGLLDPVELPVTLVPGMELTTFYGHHPVYGTKSMIPWHVDGRVLPLAESTKLARSRGALVGVAHPFVPGDPLCTGCRMVEGLDPSSFDLMEVWYRRWDSPGSDNVAAYALWNRYWAEGHRVVAVAARDWHGKEQDAPFPSEFPFTGVYADDNTPEAIVEGLRHGRVILSGGPVVDVRLADERGEVASIGESLATNAPPTIEVATRRLDGPVTLRVFRSGEVLHESTVDGERVHRFAADRKGYYRAELWAGERPRVITNHVIWE